MSLVNPIENYVERKAIERARWIDKTIESLLSPFVVSLIKSSKTPTLIKKIAIKSSGIEIVIQRLVGNFGDEVKIKQYGRVKAARKFNI